MPDEKPSDDLEKLLSELKSLKDRKQALIDDLLRREAEAVKAYDDKRAKVGTLASQADDVCRRMPSSAIRH